VRRPRLGGQASHSKRARKSWRYRAGESPAGERLAQFGLQLHEPKTRRNEFGRFAASKRQRRGEGRPETFNFLGFTHDCGRTRAGRFLVQRKTQRERMTAKLKTLRQELKRRRHQPVREQQGWLTVALRGHYADYSLTGNSRSLGRFKEQVQRAWRWALRRRGQRSRLPWARFNRLPPPAARPG
jgi:hypothetical protein